MRDHAQAEAAGFRPSIQGLRAIAVLAVVAFHLAPDSLTGGYVGVDVFFVISGYLITAHIARELTATGSLRVVRFWGRRVRRLLPASLLVLAASTVIALVWLPTTVWGQTSRQVVASTLYVENWVLARDAVDYLAADNAATVVQHYWSLSVEEQFYVVWPLLLLAAWWFWRRRSGADPRAAIAAVLALIVVGSFTASVLLTAADPAAAYFVTHTRAWEFALGGLAAVGWSARGLAAPARAALGWVGIAAIAASAALLNSSSAFPGWVAVVPVAGTLAVLAAGESTHRWAPGWWLSRRPATFVGDVSYSVYLWHWPLIVAWPWITGSRVGVLDAAVIVAATLALAWLTKVVVEDPGRSARWLRARSWHTFVPAAIATAATVVVGLSPALVLDRRAQEAERERTTVIASECYGPAIVDAPAGCGPMTGTLPITPTPARVAEEATTPDYPGCQARFQESEIVTCELGAEPGAATATIAIVGDSHATQWFPALDTAGKDRGFRVLTVTKSACPLTLATTTFAREKDDGGKAACERWRRDVLELLRTRDDIAAVVVAAYSSTYAYTTPPGVTMANPAVDGYTRAWAELIDAGIPVVAIADVPRTGAVVIPTCVEENIDDRTACAQPRQEALADQPLVAAADAYAGAGLTTADLRRYMCDEELCHAVVGSMIVFRDASHLSNEFSGALAEPLGDAIAEALTAARDAR